MAKRLFDILSCSLGLIILSPLLLIISICIVVDSRGPVFYLQERIGKGMKPFKIFKFRSMVTNADKEQLITVGERDPRVTRVGYWIRKYKLDEFPQLLNVIIGDMSVVGPRPEVRKYVEMYTPEQLKVLSVRPGITDLASLKFRNENQILEGREDSEEYYIHEIMPTKLRYNLEYIEKQSFWYDIKIIFATLRVIITE